MVAGGALREKKRALVLHGRRPEVAQQLRICALGSLALVDRFSFSTVEHGLSLWPPDEFHLVPIHPGVPLEMEPLQKLLSEFSAQMSEIWESESNYGSPFIGVPLAGNNAFSEPLVGM